MPVDIVALPYDFWYELGSGDDQLESGEEPTPLNNEGVLFYVRFRQAGQPPTRTWVDSIGYATIPEAEQAAEARVPGRIRWSRPTNTR